jgi:hypothetical protein
MYAFFPKGEEFLKQGCLEENNFDCFSYVLTNGLSIVEVCP